MHSAKFAWDEPASSSELVVRYDQLHRVASGPSSGFPLSYRAMIDDKGLLPSDPWARVPKFERPRWNCLAYIAYAPEADIQRTLEQDKFGKRMIFDEQTAFRMVTREINREYILIPSERHRDAVSLVKSPKVLGHELLTMERPSRKERPFVFRRGVQVHLLTFWNAGPDMPMARFTGLLGQNIT